MSEPMKEGLVTIHSSPTHVITYGHWIDDPFLAEDTTLDSVILIFPGNPGVITFYRDFMSSLHKRLGRRTAVWGLSHAGHDSFQNRHLPKITEEHYNLDGQIAHKVDFIRTYIPQNRKLICIGHSIGCYIILQIMKRFPDCKIDHAYLLFPTIERMAVAPNARRMKFIIKYLQVPALAVVFLVSYLSESLKKRLLSWYLNNGSRCAIEAVADFCHPTCVSTSLLMCADEFDRVLEADTDTLGRNMDRLTIYYGANDGWCPRQYFEQMKLNFPDGDILLCSRNIKHAFVLEDSETMADMIAEWISK